jgi:DNA-3-methyladenine glycosylase I
MEQPDGLTRCDWSTRDPLYVRYHDTEWGVPVHDEVRHFEFLLLEGAQAGLSWYTILRKREAYRKAYRGFDPEKVARFGDADVQRLLSDAGIVRNRLKIASSIENARHFLEVQREHGTFDAYIWGFVGGSPIVNHWKTLDTVPATTPLSDKISSDLKKRGFRFVGSTIIYAHMQAIGLVNDHLVDCFRHDELA